MSDLALLAPPKFVLALPFALSMLVLTSAFALPVLLPPPTVAAQEAPSPNGALPKRGETNLYAVVLENKRYVIGAENAPSGLFRFEGDTTWTHLGWKNLRANGLSYPRSSPDTLFIAAGNGVLRSIDSGASWRIVTGWKITEVQDIAVDAVAPNLLYAATAYGIYRSDDFGNTWSVPSRQVSPGYTQTITADADKAGHAIAGGEGGLYATDDFGQTWHSVGAGHTDVRDVQQAGPQKWLAGTGDGMLISDDDGETWRPVADLQGETIYAVAADPSDPDRLAAGGFDSGVYVSEDGGRTWEQITTGIPVLHVHALLFDSSGRLWIGTAGAGVYYLEPGSESPAYAGLNGATIWDLVSVNSTR